MFLHVSVSHSVHGGWYAEGGMHPTGMHSCWKCSSRSRISQTGRGGAPTLNLRQKSIILQQDFCQKLHVNERNQTEEGAYLWRPPLDPPI